MKLLHPCSWKCKDGRARVVMTIEGKVSRVNGMIKKLFVYSDSLDTIAFKILVTGNLQLYQCFYLLLEMQVPVKGNSK